MSVGAFVNSSHTILHTYDHLFIFSHMVGSCSFINLVAFPIYVAPRLFYHVQKLTSPCWLMELLKLCVSCSMAKSRRPESMSKFKLIG